MQLDGTGVSPPKPTRKYRCSPEKAGLDIKVMREADETLHKKVDSGELPGVISIVLRRGALAHLDCYGYADLERKLPMLPTSIVKLYSMSKCVITVAIAILLEEGRLSLDDPVSKYIPAFASAMVKNGESELVPAERPITVLHLLTHTAGIGYGPMLGDAPDGEEEERFASLIKRAGLGRTDPTNTEAISTLEHWCEELAKIPLLRQPGTEWLYSYSHDVVGCVLEVISGQRLDTFLNERIFSPLGMLDTGFEVPREKWHRSAGMYKRHEVEQAPSADAKPSDMSTAQPTPAATADSQDAPSQPCIGTPMAVDQAGDQDAPCEKPQPHDARADSAQPSHSPEATQAQVEQPVVYELHRLDSREIDTNEWIVGNSSPILAGGGSVDAMTGGLVSTGVDYARFCLMLLRKGELDGVRILKPETVKLLSTNQLPRATGKDDVWAFGVPGVGFGLLGSVTVQHEDMDTALRAHEYGWGGMAGTAWTNDPNEDFVLLSFSLVAFDLTTEEVLREGVRAAIKKFNETETRKRCQRRLERLLKKGSTEKMPDEPGKRRVITPQRRCRLQLAGRVPPTKSTSDTSACLRMLFQTTPPNKVRTKFVSPAKSRRSLKSPCNKSPLSPPQDDAQVSPASL